MPKKQMKYIFIFTFTKPSTFSFHVMMRFDPKCGFSFNIYFAENEVLNMIILFLHENLKIKRIFNVSVPSDLKTIACT